MSPETYREILWDLMESAETPHERGMFAGFLIACKYVLNACELMSIEPWSDHWPKQCVSPAHAEWEQSDHANT